MIDRDVIYCQFAWLIIEYTQRYHRLMRLITLYYRAFRLELHRIKSTLVPPPFWLQLGLAYGFILTPITDVPALSSGLWNTLEFRAGSLAALPKWTGVLARIESELPRYAACEADFDACTSTGLIMWRQFVDAERQIERSDRERLEVVNHFLNRWRYVTDYDNWSMSDYWASPHQFVNYSGDCEDYAIIKYVTLKELGISFDKLRIAVVEDVVRQLNHAVLVVYLDDEPYILDSLFDAVLRDAEVSQYRPYYSVNETTRWAHIQKF